MGVPASRSKIRHALRSCGKELLVCVVLVAGVSAIFGALYHADFVNFDDFEYVKYNVHLLRGFDWATVKWAFTPGYSSNWHPLTWFSHLLDVQLFRINPGPHHLVNVAIHAANSVLLFLLLKRMTRRFWESALVAALFAWHPLHVESVAWISERKDVLSTFFEFCAMWFYVGYARRAGEKATAWRSGYYWATLGLFALALMSKPMVVTFPFLLLLLDFWPLQRMPSRSLVRLAIEKLPFLLLSAIVCVTTLLAQDKAMVSVDKLPMIARIGTGLVSYLEYLRKMIWPNDLAVLYPYTGYPDTAKLIAAFALIAIVTCWAVRNIGRRPWFLCGWLWYLGMLVPVIGLVQVGGQTMADRYTYVPSIGVFVALTWLLSEAAWVARQSFRVATSIAVAIAVISFGFCARMEAGCWKSSITLFSHALAHTKDNYYLVTGLASALDQAGLTREADEDFKRAFWLNPKDSKLNYNYGNFCARHQRYEQSLTYFDRAIAANDQFGDAYFDKGNSLAMLGRYSEAQTNYLTALKFKPDFVNAEINVGGILAHDKQYEEARAHYLRALTMAPNHPRAHHMFGVLLGRMNRPAEATREFELAVKYYDKPDADACNDLAWMLAVVQEPSIHNPTEAIRLATQACDSNHYSNPATLDTLAVAYAEAGQFDRAIETADKTIALVQRQKLPGLLAEMARRKDLYVQHRSYHPAILTEDRPLKSMLELTPRN